MPSDRQQPTRSDADPRPPHPAPWTETLALVAGYVHTRRGPAAADQYVYAAGSPFWPAFNDHSAELDAEYASRVAVRTWHALARRVTAGRVADVDHFARLGRRVVRTTCLHYRIVSFYRARPTLPSDRVDRFGNPVVRPLFLTDVDAAKCETAAAGPVARAEYRELLAGLMREARSVGQPFVGVVQLVRRYEHALRRTHGAYKWAARYAVLDSGGRVVGFRPWRSAPSPDTPPEAVVRQVRAIHRDAIERMRTGARRLGYPMPPTGD